jgi:hypothetical protein
MNRAFSAVDIGIDKEPGALPQAGVEFAPSALQKTER